MRNIYKNIASLSLLQVANYLIPILVIPIITRVLGVELFGKVSYAQNIVTYLTLLVNYGFEFSATRQIALCCNDEQKRKQIFWSVMLVKSVLLVISFVLLALLTTFVPRLHEDSVLYWCTALINVGIVLFPTWFLQGVQQMDKMAAINFFIKLLGAVLVVSLVRYAYQYRLYPLLLSLAGMIGGVVALAYVIRKFSLYPIKIGAKSLKEVLKEGAPIFLNQIFISMYTTANLTILGFYLSDTEVGYFAGAQKIMMVANMCVILPVSTAIFPEMSKRWEEDNYVGERYFRKVLCYAGMVGLLLSTLLYILSPWLVSLFLGEDFVNSVLLLKWMSFVPALIMIATILTVQGLYGHGLQRYAPWVGLGVGVICVSMNMTLIPRYGEYSCVVSMMVAEMLEIIIVGCILAVNKRKSI